MSAGLKACEIASIMGVSQGYVSQIESGKKENVSKEILLKAAAKFGVSVDYLLTGTDPPVTLACETGAVYNTPGYMAVAPPLLSCQRCADLERQLDRANDTIASQARTIESMQQKQNPSAKKEAHP